MSNDDNRSVFNLARKMLAPYELNKKLRLIHPGELIIPGVTAIEAFGHTPGHTAFLFRSKKDSLLLWGDLVHSAGIQFAKPDLHVSFDIDGRQAVISRRRLLAEAADRHLLVGGAHLPFSGLGYVALVEGIYVWEPIEYGLRSLNKGGVSSDPSAHD